MAEGTSREKAGVGRQRGGPNIFVVQVAAEDLASHYSNVNFVPSMVPRQLKILGGVGQIKKMMKQILILIIMQSCGLPLDGTASI